MAEDSEHDVDALREQFRSNTRRALQFWVFRWSVGLGGAIGIVLWTGQHHWLPWAAAGIALLSLGVIGLNAYAMMKSIAKAEARANDP